MNKLLDWWIEDTLNRIPERQIEESQTAVEGLPYFVNSVTGKDVDDNGNKIPFGTGPHNFQSFAFWSKVIPHPNVMLEIGFNIGHGAAALLHLFPNSKLISIDIRDSSEVRNAHTVLDARYPGRHELVIGDSTVASFPNSFQAAFIDGAHDLDSIKKDIETCRRHGVKHFLFDDVHPRHGDTIEAIKLSRLKLNAIVGANMAICEEFE